MAGLSRVKTYALKRLAVYAPVSVFVVFDTQMWLIKEAFLYGTDGVKGGVAAWSVLGSSDSVNFNMSGTDLWDVPAKIVHSTGNHSWIVLQQPLQGSAPGYLQVCLDFPFTSSAPAACHVSFSISAGYTGGSISARPTAIDEIVVNTAEVVSTSGATGSCGVNCLKSTDGKVTRMIVTKDGALQPKAYWVFEELADIESYWTSKTVVAVAPLSHAGLNSTSNLFNYQGGSNSGKMSWASSNTYALSSSNGPTTMNRPDYGGAWPVFPCGVFNDVGASRGKLGNFADLWAVSYASPTGEYFAGSGGGDFQYVNIGGLVFPWDGTPLILP